MSVVDKLREMLEHCDINAVVTVDTHRVYVDGKLIYTGDVDEMDPSLACDIVLMDRQCTHYRHELHRRLIEHLQILHLTVLHVPEGAYWVYPAVARMDAASLATLVQICGNVHATVVNGLLMVLYGDDVVYTQDPSIPVEHFTMRHIASLIRKLHV